jgi:endonuclease III
VTAADGSKELAALLRRLRDEHPAALAEPPVPCPVDAAEPTLGCFLRSFMLWESTGPKAAQAVRKIEAAVVDYNELRACMPDELVKVIGERYPRAAERALRLRTALNVLFARHHAVTLEHLGALPPKEARAALDGLDGVPAFVSARVCLLHLGHHAAPVDSRIARRLAEAGVVPEGAPAEECVAALERRLRPGELPEAYALLQAWADDAAYPPAESHLADLKPRHKPVAQHVREQAEAERRAARKARLRPVRKKKPLRGKPPGKKKPRDD